MSRKRVVLVCMVDSIHVARWIAQFEPSEVEFTLFPSTPNRRVHAKIKDMMAKDGNIKLVPFGGKLSIPLWGIDLFFSDYVRGLLLRGVLKRQHPDFVHALELQHGGYIASRALEDSSIKTQFIATNYGSDIYWFQQFPKHLSKIKKLLARADRYSAECTRDVELANGYGFKGEILPVIPNAGGFTSEMLRVPFLAWDERGLIVVKGYDGWVGRAMVVLKAIENMAAEIANLKIVVISANRKTRTLAKRVAKSTGLSIQVYGKKRLSHTETLKLLGRAKLYVGASLSDGISTTFLEAMLMGAYPVQTSSACISDWLLDGAAAESVEHPNEECVENAISRGLNKGSGSQVLINREVVICHASQEVVGLKAAQYYLESMVES